MDRRRFKRRLHLYFLYPRNPISASFGHSHCEITGQEAVKELEELVERENIGNVIQKPIQARVGFFFGKDKSKAPSILLTSGHSTSTTLISLKLFDDLIYEDTETRGLLLSALPDGIWNVAQLNDALRRVTLEFVHFHSPEMPLHAEQMWPHLHNLQLSFGEKSQHVLLFSLDDLSKQVVGKKENTNMSGPLSHISLTFEKRLDEALCAKQLFTYA